MNITIIQENNVMWIAADSYPSMTYNKDTNKFQEHSLLFFPVNEKIICCFGKTELINFIMMDFMVSQNQSVEELAIIAAGYYEDWTKYHPDNPNEGIVDMIVALQVMDGVEAYAISPTGNFVPQKVKIPQGVRYVWSVGYKSQEAVLLLNSLLMDNQPLHHIIPSVYKSISSPEIGGVVTVYQLDQHGTCLYMRVPIDSDNKIVYSDRGGAIH